MLLLFLVFAFVITDDLTFYCRKKNTNDELFPNRSHLRIPSFNYTNGSRHLLFAVSTVLLNRIELNNILRHKID